MSGPSKGLLAAVIAAYLLFTISILVQVDSWADITAAVFGLLAAAMIFYTVLSAKNKQFRSNFLFAAAAIAFWGLADLLWYIYDELLFVNPDTNSLNTILHLGTKLSLTVSILLYAYSRLRRWDTVQLMLDGAVFSIAILWVIWIVMYNKNTDMLQSLLSYSVIHSLTIVLDVFIIIVISIWFLSIRRGTLPLFLQISIASVFLFAITDLVYYHLYVRDLYIPDSFLDVCYLTTLLGIALAALLYYRKYPDDYQEQSPNTNIGNRHKGLLLVLCPLFILIFHPLELFDIVLYALLILIHETSSSYIQSTINAKTLLFLEKDANKKLELLVSERTRELQLVNATLQRRNDELYYLNLHDSLTGQYNRTHFLEALEVAINTAKPDESVGLILWNIDNLKGINDTYGHTAGDDILITHGHAIEKQLGTNGVLARFSSDEFAYMITGSLSGDSLMQTASQIADTCAQPMKIGEYCFQITISIGISLYPVCASDRKTLLKNADIAMQYAKKMPPGKRIAKYMDIDKTIERKALLANSMKTMDFDHDLKLYFQPQFCIANRKMIGMEELLRWNCPGIGFVPPAEFIPIAEAENHITAIGNWVIENAVRQIAQWNRKYGLNLRMGINISPKQFEQPGTFALLESTMQRYQAKPEWIDIEITEGVAMDNKDSAEKIKTHFRSKGITVSIDDFGTGYSSLGYLSILSFDRLKIAKPLVDNITTDESSRKIVTSIVLLAKSFEMQTIAEGVETKEQFDLLGKLGCDQIQGYYLGKPVPARTFVTQFLKPLTDTQTP